jgi:peptidyl-prolyl cis-trans isomerase SurA
MDTITFSSAIRRFSEEEQSKTRAGRITNPATGDAYFELGDLEPSVYFAIDGLQQGDLSKVIEFDSRTGEKQFRIVKIISRTQPHPANMNDDYSKIRMAALEEKKGQFISSWVQSKLAKNYIEIKLNNLGDMAEDVMKCTVMDKWISSSTGKP